MGDLGPTVIAFPLVGYLLLRHCCHRSSFRWDALEWEHNLFESTGVGVVLFAIARLLAPLVQRLPGVGRVGSFLDAWLPIPYASTVVASVTLGLVLAWAANRRWPIGRALDLVVAQHGGRLRVLLHDAYREDRPVMLNLNSRKVYVGLVLVAPPLRKPSHVVILPTLSGHREPDTLEIRWTTTYEPAYTDIIERSENEPTTTRLEHFQLVVPLDTIVTATYFDKKIYDAHFARGAPDV